MHLEKCLSPTKIGGKYFFWNSRIELNEALLKETIKTLEDLKKQLKSREQTFYSPLALEGKRINGAKHKATGTGKTAAFGVTILQIIDKKKKG